MKMAVRISQRQVEELSSRVGERDKSVLLSLEKCRYLTTNQITRLHFNNSPTPTAALRAANRNLNKLKDYGLIGALRRRVGGMEQGSSPYIWLLKPAGRKLLRLNNTDDTPRKRFFEPSPYFLNHTLATAEAYIQLSEICARNGAQFTIVAFEPQCWRWYDGKHGKRVAFKPDFLCRLPPADGARQWLHDVGAAAWGYSS